MKRSLAVLALVLLTGCFLVKDFGAIWDQATPDPCLEPIAKSLYHSEFMRDPEGKDMSTIARGITLDGFYYLLLKAAPGDKQGRMYRFEIHNGIFQRMRLDPAMRHPFEVDYPNAPVEIEDDTVLFEKLGKKELALIAEIAGKSEYWEIEDQALYNVLRNPACRFDDRELSKKE